MSDNDRKQELERKKAKLAAIRWHGKKISHKKTLIRAERVARLKEKESRDSTEQQTQPASFSIDKNLESLGIAPVTTIIGSIFIFSIMMMIR